MDKLTGENITQAQSMRKIAFASSLGTTVEWYDFYIYGIAAGLVFGPLFFPEFSEVAGTLAAFATFAVGFIARPLGGIIFGHLGDKIGRKAMLVATIMIMGIGTFLIGILPTYASIGLAAPVLLIVVRFVQGIGLGGEWGGAVLMTIEHSPPSKRGFYASWPQMGVAPALLLSYGVFLILAEFLSRSQMDVWGWRLPFMFSLVLVGVGLYIRLRITETPAFRRVQKAQSQSQMPIVDVLCNYPKQVLLCAGTMVLNNAMFFVLITFMLSYATTTVGVDRGAVLRAILLSSIILFVFTVVGGALSDKVGRRPVILSGHVLGGLFAFPIFWLVNTGRPLLVSVAIIVGMIPPAVVWGAMAAFFAELFGTRVRYSGISLGLQFGTILGGGFAPFISAWLLATFGGSWAISLYLTVLALVSIASVFLLSETYSRVDVAEEQTKSASEEPLEGGSRESQSKTL